MQGSVTLAIGSGVSSGAALGRLGRRPVWRHVKDQLACHRWWADLPALQRATAFLPDHLRAEFHRPGGIRLVHDLSEAA